MTEAHCTTTQLLTLRERMLRLGPTALSTSELMALVLGTGHTNDALELAERLYAEYGGLMGIARLSLITLKK